MRLPSARGQDLQTQVRECALELNLILPLLLTDYSSVAVAVSLAFHGVRALAGCVRSGEVTREQARALLKRMEKLKLTERTRIR